MAKYRYCERILREFKSHAKTKNKWQSKNRFLALDLKPARQAPIGKKGEIHQVITTSTGLRG